MSRDCRRGAHRSEAPTSNLRTSVQTPAPTSTLALAVILTLAACQGSGNRADGGSIGDQAVRGSESAEAAGFPTPETTGPRIPSSQMVPSPSLVSESEGEIIEGLDVEGGIKVVHDNVTVRDVRITQTATKQGQFALVISPRSDGICPSDVLVENIEVVGDIEVLAPGTKAVYGECPFTLRSSRIHHVATGVRITNDTVIEGNYILADFWESGDDAHRSGVGLNGGSHNVIRGNTITCEGPGCSGALVIYGDFARPVDILVERNVLSTTGSYCTYAGSSDSKEFPVAKDVRYIGNTFSREYFPTCGRYGPAAGRDSGGGPGFVWQDNVWLDTGEEVTFE